MPTLGEFEYGYETGGVDQYLEDIKANLLTEAQTRVNNIGNIRTACEATWEGKAREKFLDNLQKDAKHVGDQFKKLYDALEKEVKQVRGAMSEKDKNMFN